MDPRFPQPKLREEFRRELRARLLSEAQTVLVPRRRETAWTFLRPALGVGLAAVILMAGAGTAAAGSVPGDPAFALKRAVEELQVTLTFDDVRRVELLASLTDRRLAELQKVADREDKAPTASEAYAAAVTKFRAAVDALQRAAPQEKKDKAQDVADAAREKHEAIIEDLRERLPEKAKPALDRAKDEEDRDTPERAKQKDPRRSARPERSPERSETPEPSRTPRPSSTARGTDTPRTTERADSPRPLTPRPSFTAHPSATAERDDD